MRKGVILVKELQKRSSVPPHFQDLDTRLVQMFTYCKWFIPESCKFQAFLENSRSLAILVMKKLPEMLQGGRGDDGNLRDDRSKQVKYRSPRSPPKNSLRGFRKNDLQLVKTVSRIRKRTAKSGLRISQGCTYSFPSSIDPTLNQTQHHLPTQKTGDKTSKSGKTSNRGIMRP